LPSVETVEILSSKIESFNFTQLSVTDKKKTKSSVMSLSPTESSKIIDFSLLLDCLTNQNPLAINITDYRNLCSEMEGPLNVEEKVVFCKYLRLQTALSKMRVANTKSFLDNVAHLL